jgi:hypothetical protein
MPKDLYSNFIGIDVSKHKLDILRQKMQRMQGILRLYKKHNNLLQELIS